MLELVKGYKAKDIWNMVFFGGHCQRLVLGRGVRSVKGEKRITIALFVNATGEKEKPIVIWKSEKPRYLKRFDKQLLPVSYFSQKNHG